MAKKTTKAGMASRRKPDPPAAKMVRPLEVGDIVLMRIAPNVSRPLVVVSLDGDAVSGELFLDYTADGGALWVQAHMFYKPHRGERTTWVNSVTPGDDLGQYRRKETS